MPIEITCQCGKKYRVDESLAGRRMQCKHCRTVVQIPTAAVNESALLELLDETSYSLDLSGEDDPLEPWQRPATRGSFDTSASLPVKLRINWLHLVRSFWKQSLLLGGGLLLFPLAALVMGPALLLPWLAVLLIIAYRIFYLTSKFAGGDLVPAIVVAADPWLVACYTDLTTSAAHGYSVIKILEQPLEQMTAGPPRVGMPLAAAALYLGDIQQPHWSNFFPTVLNCAIANPVAVQSTMDRIPDELWRELASGLKQIPAQSPGLYTLWDNGIAGRHSTRRLRLLARCAAAAGLVAVAAVVAISALLPGRAQFNAPAAAKNPPPQPLQQIAQPAPRAQMPLPQANPALPAADPAVAADGGKRVEVLIRGRWLPGTVIGEQGIRTLVLMDHDASEQLVAPGRLRHSR